MTQAWAAFRLFSKKCRNHGTAKTPPEGKVSITAAFTERYTKRCYKLLQEVVAYRSWDGPVSQFFM